MRVFRIALKKVYFEKTSFEAQHFGNGDKKHADQILLLFLKEAELWTEFGFKTDNASVELLKVVSQNGQNHIFHFSQSRDSPINVPRKDKTHNI